VEPDIILEGARIKYNKHPIILGVTLHPKLLWNYHIESIMDSTQKRTNMLKALSNRTWGADMLILRQFYLGYINPKITYACEVWGDLAQAHLQEIQKLQNCALQICLGCPKTSPVRAMEMELNIEILHIYIKKRSGKLSLKCKTILPEHPSSHLIPSSLAHKHSLQYLS
jgi:hypothetical protein